MEVARRCGTAVALLVRQASWMLGASKAVLPAPNQSPVTHATRLVSHEERPARLFDSPLVPVRRAVTHDGPTAAPRLESMRNRALGWSTRRVIICRSITLQQGGTQTSAAAGEPEHAGHTHNLEFSLSRHLAWETSQASRPTPRSSAAAGAPTSGSRRPSPPGRTGWPRIRQGRFAAGFSCRRTWGRLNMLRSL